MPVQYSVARARPNGSIVFAKIRPSLFILYWTMLQKLASRWHKTTFHSEQKNIKIL